MTTELITTLAVIHDFQRSCLVAPVVIAYQGDTEYLKSIPNDIENDNFGNLHAVSSEQNVTA